MLVPDSLPPSVASGRPTARKKSFPSSREPSRRSNNKVKKEKKMSAALECAFKSHFGVYITPNQRWGISGSGHEEEEVHGSPSFPQSQIPLHTSQDAFSFRREAECDGNSGAPYLTGGLNLTPPPPVPTRPRSRRSMPPQSGVCPANVVP